MATYKVLQDIEAEDKLVGPLTLRQCIYAAVGAVCLWLSWLCIAQGFPIGVFFFLPFIGTAVFFAFPWRKEQSTEVWALAKVRFMLKPRKRIWDQAGARELVTVTAPRRVVQQTRRRLSEDEVRGRLKALAETVDSRGWAVKNVPLDMYLQTGAAMAESDRLVGGTNLPNQVSIPDAIHGNDMFDMAVNPLAAQFEEKMNAAASARRQELVNQVDNPVMTPPQPAAPAQQWFASPQQPQGGPVALDPDAQEMALSEAIKQKQQQLHDGHGVTYGHMRVIQPLDVQGQPQTPVAPVDTDQNRPDLQSNFATPTPVAIDPNDPNSLAAQAAQLMGGSQGAPAALPYPAMPATMPGNQGMPGMPNMPGMPTMSGMPMADPAMAMQAGQGMPAGPMMAQQQGGPVAYAQYTQQPAAPVTPPPNPAILELANNNDLDVATIAREARRQTEGPVDEVVVSLH